MKKLLLKKELVIIATIVGLFLFVSVLSLVSIRQLSGNARVVNYVGIVRGATQKLVKEELMRHPDDQLIARLDSIVANLLTGEGQHGLILLQDEVYLANMREVRQRWLQLKELITDVRAGGDPWALFEASQDYFILVDRTVFSAEAFSEKQVKKSTNILVGANIFFVLFIICSILIFVRALTVKRKAEALKRIAYVDQLTKIHNRASCEKLFDDIGARHPSNSLAVFMFDMNDLKMVNDFLGHRGGDRIISTFAGIVDTEAGKHGFAGRYGGDEFIAVFEDADEDTAKTFIAEVRKDVAAYNATCVNNIEKISFAVGYVINNVDNMSIESMLDEADRRMYANKRNIKLESAVSPAIKGG